MRRAGTNLLLGQHLPEWWLLRLQSVRRRRQFVPASAGHLQCRIVQRRSLRRSGQTLLPDGNQHERKLLHRPRHEVRVQCLCPVRKQRWRFLLLHHARLIGQQHHSRLPGQRSGLQQRIFLERRLLHLWNAGQSLLSRQQVQWQRLLLQRTMRGRVGFLRAHHGRHRGNDWNQSRRVHSRQVRRLRCCGTAVLRNQHLRRRPFLSQQRLCLLRRPR